MDVFRRRGFILRFVSLHLLYRCFSLGSSDSDQVSSTGYGKIGFDRRFRVYQIEDFGETIRTYKRTESGEIVDSQVLAGKGLS